MTFTDTLKELVGKATKGPWEADEIGNIGVSGTRYGPAYPAQEGSVATLQDGEYTENPRAKEDAALIVHLVNHAEDIVALVEALERIRPSLLKVVRKLDFGAPCSPEEFARAFDDLRSFFSENEIAYGELDEHPLLSSRLEAKP